MALRQVHLAASATSVTRRPGACRAFVFSNLALPGVIVLTITSRKIQQITDIFRKITKSLRAGGRLHLNRRKSRRLSFGSSEVVCNRWIGYSSKGNSHEKQSSNDCADQCRALIQYKFQCLCLRRNPHAAPRSRRAASRHG